MADHVAEFEASGSDQAWMRRALALAARGRGFVEPNPMVGAVVVRDGQVLGEGYHHRFGLAHAEVEALNQCRARGTDPAGATIYVTLEPCSHYGKTPPCAKAIIEAKLGRMVAAMVDPFERVAGRGLVMLREAGIRTEVGLCEDEARLLNETFIKRVTTGLPWVIVKWAQTLDGRIAAAGGESKWISSEASRRRVHELRGRMDAIMVGPGTAARDDPRLTARGEREVDVRRIARRVVLDPDLKLNGDLKLFADPDPPVTVAVRRNYLVGGHPTAEAWRERGIEVVGLPELEALGTGGAEASPGLREPLDLRPLLAHLAEAHAATNVLVEGGAGMNGALFAQGLVDQVLAFVAPKLLGDRHGISAVTGMRCDEIAAATRLTLRGVERIGDDVLLDYRVGKSVEERADRSTSFHG